MSWPLTPFNLPHGFLTFVKVQKELSCDFEWDDMLDLFGRDLIFYTILFSHLVMDGGSPFKDILSCFQIKFLYRLFILLIPRCFILGDVTVLGTRKCNHVIEI